MRIVDRLDEAFAALDAAEQEAGSADLPDELARLHHLRGNLFFPLGNIAGCREAHEQALDYAQRASSTDLEARALSGLGDAEYNRGRMITANGYFRRCVELAASNSPSVTDTGASRWPTAAWSAFRVITQTKSAKPTRTVPRPRNRHRKSAIYGPSCSVGS
jgi:tetratricopeptide (TPR) repeat protein